MAVFRARFTLQPARMKAPDTQPPSRLPAAAPAYGTQAKSPICLMSNPNCSVR